MIISREGVLGAWGDVGGVEVGLRVFDVVVIAIWVVVIAIWVRVSGGLRVFDGLLVSDGEAGYDGLLGLFVRKMSLESSNPVKVDIRLLACALFC